MSARDIVGGLAGAAVGAVKHPVGTAGEAVSKARTAVGAGTAVGTAVAGTVFRRVRGDAADAKSKAAETAKDASESAKETAKETAGTAAKAPGKAAGVAKESAATVSDLTDKAQAKAKTTADKAQAKAKTTADKAEDAAAATVDKAEDAAETATDKAKKAAKKAPANKSTAKKAPAKKTAKKSPAQREPQVVLAEPAPPAEPPVDVVGEALAAEAQDPDNVGFGRTTEPRGASRDEEHGEAALQRAEAAEIMEEIAEASSSGRIDIDTPVHTTGADVGFNPDTAEADLQQPGTEPIVDPSLTNEVKSEQDILSEAAKPKKPKPKKKS